MQKQMQNEKKQTIWVRRIRIQTFYIIFLASIFFLCFHSVFRLQYLKNNENNERTCFTHVYTHTHTHTHTHLIMNVSQFLFIFTNILQFSNIQFFSFATNIVNFLVMFFSYLNIKKFLTQKHTHTKTNKQPRIFWLVLISLSLYISMLMKGEKKIIFISVFFLFVGQIKSK